MTVAFTHFLSPNLQLHYWLRCPIGFSMSKKCPKVDGCFSLKDLPKLTILHFLWRVWPKFFAKLFSACVDKKSGKFIEKRKGGLRWSWFFCAANCIKSMDHYYKKLKILSLYEAPFMDFIGHQSLKIGIIWATFTKRFKQNSMKWHFPLKRDSE